MPEIERAVRRAAPNKAPGIDGITSGVLHQTLDILLPTLCSLIRYTMDLNTSGSNEDGAAILCTRRPHHLTAI
ncbi:Uncharacterized protein HZ326_18960 [Fusarium oxysporum f. sp. albedinis]|nr:Uncharacterized protein HZ326_18960 [Fusarium oxysporum f. sp. albedinis]